MAEELDACNELLAKSRAFLTGSTPCQADCFLFAILEMVCHPFQCMAAINPGYQSLIRMLLLTAACMFAINSFLCEMDVNNTSQEVSSGSELYLSSTLVSRGIWFDSRPCTVSSDRCSFMPLT
jgi:hypothetical protein